jgi:hypothetical protein
MSIMCAALVYDGGILWRITFSHNVVGNGPDLDKDEAPNAQIDADHLLADCLKDEVDSLVDRRRVYLLLGS